MMQDPAREVTFLSYHYWGSERRAGFHGLAQAFLDLGWKVRFVTTGLSRISFLQTDSRLGRLKRKDWNRWQTAPDGVETYVYCPWVHPFSRSVASDQITDRLFAHLYLKGLPDDLGRGLSQSDIVVFESNESLLLFDEVGRVAPQAKRVYRVSDDVEVMGMTRSVIAAEEAVAGRFDLISVGSRVLLEQRFGDLPTARFHAQGIDTSRLEAARTGPHPELARPSCVALGTTLFDADLVALCARARPDMTFYIVGALPQSRRVALPNIVWCGERPFEEALGMAAACDVAAAFYRPAKGTEYLAETSNKIYQYTFFRKPIIGPHQLKEPLRRMTFFPIEPRTEEGARAAIGQALRCQPPEAPASVVRPWAAVRDEIIEDVGVAARVPAAATELS